MNIGDLNKRIRILTLLNQSDGAGGIIESNFDSEDGYQLVKETWAGIRPASAKEKTAAYQEMNLITHEVVIRYDSNIRENMIIKYRGRRLDINTIINLGENDRLLKIQCTEKRDE